jgi:hypothetical protein
VNEISGVENDPSLPAPSIVQDEDLLELLDYWLQAGIGKCWACEGAGTLAPGMPPCPACKGAGYDLEDA